MGSERGRAKIVLVGHLTIDVFGKHSRLGGSVLYMARTLAHFHHQVTVVTSGPAQGLTVLRDLGCQVLTATSDQRVTTFVFDDLGEQRHLCCPTVADPLDPRLLDGLRASELLLLAPVAGECGAGWLERASGAKLLSLQGWLRARDANNHVVPQKPPSYLFSSSYDAAVCSELDAPRDELLPLLGAAQSLVITLGQHGATLCQLGQPELVVPTTPLEVEDQVGAGDTFAAGYALGMLEGRDPEGCARAGHAAATRLLTESRSQRFGPIPAN